MEEFAEGGKIYVFISMDTLNDSLSFISWVISVSIVSFDI